MARKSKKPERIGTVWVANAVVWVIDCTGEIPKRKNLAVCIDTPNAVKAELAKLRKAGHRDLWSTGDASGKQYHG